MEPLSRLNEHGLAQRFGISRTPLREAVRVLAAEGLVELLPNRGARVAKPSMNEIDHMLEVVAALEGSAAELACQHISDDGIRRLEELDRLMLASWERQDEANYFVITRQIHDAIIEASGNPVLQELHRSLSGRVQRARFSAHKTHDQWAESVAEHRTITRLLAAREGAALAQHMRQHIRSKKTVIAAAFGDDPATAPAKDRRAQIAPVSS